MEAVGLFFLIVICIVIFGLCGKLLGIIGSILGWLIDGIFEGIGCLIWIFIIIIVILAICS